ncbi:MAG: DUF4905 domain-containing protein [Bacteroidota bacterium]|jgi:hypothetical protein|nr:DUF4905 domain-containing protein [Bacteroidota bacterium]
MKLFRKSASQSWPPVWHIDAGATLWRVLFSDDGHVLGEVRDLDAKTAWFFCAREEDGTIRWNDLRTDEPWWVGIEEVGDGRFYLHGFRKPDMPQHRGIHAYDLATGQPLWRNEELAFLFVFDGSVYAAEERFAGRHVLRLSRDDGSVVEELGVQDDRIAVMRGMLNDQAFAGYRYPQPFDETHPRHGELRAHVHAAVRPDRVTGTLDVWSEDGLLVMAWHEEIAEKNGTYRQELRAVDLADGQTIFHDTIVDAAQGPGIDSFFIKHHRLYYVKNYRTLTAHDISLRPR